MDPAVCCSFSNSNIVHNDDDDDDDDDEEDGVGDDEIQSMAKIIKPTSKLTENQNQSILSGPLILSLINNLEV